MRHPDILTREGTVLLICDVQKRCIKPIYRKEPMINNIKTLVSFAGLTGLPILLTELAPQTFGSTIEEIKGLVPRLEPIKRSRYSCFGNEDLTLRLEAMNTNTLVVAGMETHISVCQTVLDALTRGYRVHVVLDATSSRRKVDWRVALEKMRRAGAIITTMEMVMNEIIERVDVPQYEKFQELVGTIGR
ncbi:MAG: Isochorismatase [Candidatus Ozemobacter sibiricus]|jgi:nicotinamidase-related amidase|uniref:Isochorismatase n=1 Tax=Candidatus Ozemobacter sibiricus TaxID=2268124 RepID=A0A367ZNV0_9BACT|nr:MAG: Isochorismatase [Candidatus Ozemobacter sibiricus]